MGCHFAILRNMINKALLALIFSFLAANQAFAYKEGATLEEKNTEDRCFVLNSLAKKHSESVAQAASEDEMYSIFFNYDAISHAGKIEQSKETKERVRKLKQAKDDINSGVFKGDAKAKATRTTYYEMNTIVRSLINEADKQYPECHILKSPTATKPAAQPASPNNSVR
jgi:hypothetical protein